MTLLTDIFGTHGTSEYAANLTSIRRRGSINILSVVTAEQLPDAVIEDVAYLESAEIELISDLKISVSEINSLLSDVAKKKSLQYLLVIGTVLKMLDQFIQITSETSGRLGTEYSEQDWAAKEMFLKDEYSKQLAIISPSTSSTSDAIGINIVSTRSRLG